MKVEELLKLFEDESLEARLKRIKYQKTKVKKAGYLTEETLIKIQKNIKK